MMKFMIFVFVIGFSLVSCQKEVPKTGAFIGNQSASVANDNFDDLKKKKDDESCETEDDLKKKLEAPKAQAFQLQGGDAGCDVNEVGKTDQNQAKH